MVNLVLQQSIIILLLGCLMVVSCCRVLTQFTLMLHFYFTDCDACCCRITQASIVAIPSLLLFIWSQESFGFDHNLNVMIRFSPVLSGKDIYFLFETWKAVFAFAQGEYFQSIFYWCFKKMGRHLVLVIQISVLFFMRLGDEFQQHKNCLL